MFRNFLLFFFLLTSLFTRAQVWVTEPFSSKLEAVPHGDTLIYYSYSADAPRITWFEWSTNQYHITWLSDSAIHFYPLHLLPNGNVVAGYRQYYQDSSHYQHHFKLFAGGSLTETHTIADPANDCRILAIAYSDTNTLVYHSVCGGHNGYVIVLDANFENPDTLISDLTTNYSFQMPRQLAVRPPNEIQITGILHPYSIWDYSLHRYSAPVNLPLVVDMTYPGWIQQIIPSTEPNIYNIKNTLGYSNFDVFGFNAYYYQGFSEQEFVGVVQLDAAGLPEKGYTYLDPAGHDYVFSDLCATPDGGYLLLANRGENTSTFTFPPGEGILLQKLNDTLGLEWSQFFPVPVGYTYFAGTFVFPFQNGYCIQGGAFLNGNSQSFFLILDENGVISGIEESDSAESLLLSPNPNNGSFRITWPNEQLKHVQIFNLSGALVHEENTGGTETHSLELNLGNGVYFVQAVNAGGYRVIKMFFVNK